MTSQPDVLRLEHVRVSPRRVKVTARWAGELVYIDTLDTNSAKARGRFAKELRKKVPEASLEVIEAEFLRLAGIAPSGDGQAEKPAEPKEVDATPLNEMPQDIRDEAQAMLADPLLIKRVLDDVATLGVAGERELVATVYLIGVSRLLTQPLAGIVQGPSSSGKSYVIEKTATLFPPEAVIHATQMTPQALFHMRPGTLAHHLIVAGERSRIEDDEKADATRALREMISAGRLTKLMPMKAEGGRIETVQIEQAGPIAYVESTTLTRIFDEDANRCLLLHTDERPEQTRRILLSLANAHSGASNNPEMARIIQRHYTLQRMLEPSPVVVPFATRLSDLFVNERVEARRAFPQVLSMIQAVTLLHQRQRQKDADGRLIAVPDDYQLAHRLLAKPMARLLSGKLSDPARRFYDRLAGWATGDFTTSEAKTHEVGSKSAVYGWLHDLHEAGMLEMVEAPRGRLPARWRLAGTTSDDTLGAGLPTVEQVFPELTWNHGQNPEPVAPT
jgi:hypothetical protein